MGSEVVTGHQFEETFSGLIASQREYISLISCGIPDRRALKIVGRSKMTLKQWRENDGFHFIEDSVKDGTGNKEILLQDLDKIVEGYIVEKMMKGLKNFDNIEKTADVKWFTGIYLSMRKNKEEGSTSWEEVVHTLHKKK